MWWFAFRSSSSSIRERLAKLFDSGVAILQYSRKQLRLAQVLTEKLQTMLAELEKLVSEYRLGPDSQMHDETAPSLEDVELSVMEQTGDTDASNEASGVPDLPCAEEIIRLFGKDTNTEDRALEAMSE
ncbi:hypothetical protein PMIN03_012900, partial [Paraphaeosphaeria minitans]